MIEVSDSQLHEQHTSDAIAERVAANTSHGYFGDFVLGAVDGAVTTFAIVSGVAGTGLEGGVLVAFVLGIANVLADGFSMGVSNFLKASSDVQRLNKFRRVEEMHIERIPDGERDEIRHIYAEKGFSGETLDKIVEVITSNRKLWIDTMLTEEWGLQISPPKPLYSGFVTFLAFLLAGMIPLLPLLLGFSERFSADHIFLGSAVLTAVTFFFTGALRGRVLGESIWQGAFETLAVGCVAALLAFIAGNLLSGLVH